jgi:hypothetical protein
MLFDQQALISQQEGPAISIKKVFPQTIILTPENIEACKEYTRLCAGRVDDHVMEHQDVMPTAEQNKPSYTMLTGAWGEAAVSQFTKIPWDQKGETRHRPDMVINGIKAQIRNTRMGWRLLVRTWDANYGARYVIGCFGTAPEITIKGWIWIEEAFKMKECFGQHPFPKHFLIPYTQLHLEAFPDGQLELPILAGSSRDSQTVL